MKAEIRKIDKSPYPDQLTRPKRHGTGRTRSTLGRPRFKGNSFSVARRQPPSEDLDMNTGASIAARTKHQTRFVWIGHVGPNKNAWRGTCSCGWEGAQKDSINAAIGSMIAHERYYRRKP